MGRFMRRRSEFVEADVLRVPADVWEPVKGECERDWSDRWLQWFRDHDFALGKTVLAPDGSVFHRATGPESKAILAVFDRTHAVRQWRQSHPGR